MSEDTSVADKISEKFNNYKYTHGVNPSWVILDYDTKKKLYREVSDMCRYHNEDNSHVEIQGMRIAISESHGEEIIQVF